MDSFHQCVAVIFSCVLASLLLLWKKNGSVRSRGKTVPEPVGAWPIIGHLHILQPPVLPHILFASLADKYGPIFALRIGLRKTLVVSDSEIAKECFTTHDRVFANRPNMVVSKIMGYNHAMFGPGPYGPYWPEMRKIAILELLSNRRLELLKHVDVRGQHFEFLPFGSGRRSCPGISFVLQVVHLALARLLQGFNFATPMDAPVDMTESAGLTNLKATPLEVLITPHLPSHLY